MFKILNSYAVATIILVIDTFGLVPLILSPNDLAPRLLVSSTYSFTVSIGLLWFAFLISYAGHADHDLEPLVWKFPGQPKVRGAIDLTNQTAGISIAGAINCLALGCCILFASGSISSVLSVELVSSFCRVLVLVESAWVVGYQIFVVIYDNFRAKNIRIINRNAGEISASFKPEFALFAVTDQHRSVVTMWTPYLKLLNRKFVFITSIPKDYVYFRDILDIPSILVEGPTVRSLVPETVRTVFFPIMRGYNDVPIRLLHEVRQVFIGHGESDKGASAHKLYRSYDKFCIPGQAGIDRFIERGIEVRDDFFVTIGRPQLENLVTASDQGKTSSEIQKVLYAPTWFGSSADDHHSSISRGAEIVKAIIDKGWTVIFRPHPLSLIDVPLTIEADDRRYVREIDQIIEEAVSRTGKPHLGSKQSSIMDVYECMNFSDALVTDVSSMIVDYLITDKPIAVNSNYRTLEEFYDAKPNMRDLYSIDKSLSNLSDSLDLLKSDPKVGERVRQKVYYLGAAKPSAQVQYFLSKIELLLR